MTALKVIGGFFLGGILILFLVVSIGTCNTGAKFIQNGQQTIYDQLKPSELLRKYEWFKDASAQLDAKWANIQVYEQRFRNIKEAYGIDSSRRQKWSRDDIESWNQWQSEMAGITASYNDLAAEYNAQMAKINWRFCNIGGLPQGSTQVLPREYRQYLIQ